MKKNHYMTLDEEEDLDDDDEEIRYEEAGSTDIPIFTDLDTFLRSDFENAEDN